MVLDFWFDSYYQIQPVFQIILFPVHIVMLLLRAILSPFFRKPWEYSRQELDELAERIGRNKQEAEIAREDYRNLVARTKAAMPSGPLTGNVDWQPPSDA